MPALSRFVFLGLQAAAFLVTLGPGLAPLFARATPVPSPVPLTPHIADYAARTPVKTYYAGAVPVLGNGTSPSQPDADPSAVEGTPPVPSSGVRHRQDTLTTFMSYVGILIDLSTSVNNTSAPQEAVVAAAEISDTLRAFRDLLGDQQKGLANFDPNDPLEGMLENLINPTKDALEALDILVYKFPVLGPILGPIVYEVKCILDAILDLIENITDGVINALLPDLSASLRVVIRIAVTVTCNSGSSPQGFCVGDPAP